MQFMDTHIHLQDFKQRCATDIIAEAQKVGIDKLVCVSATEADWDVVAALYEKFPQTIIPAFGLHPWYVDNATTEWPERLKEYLKKYSLALVGETGLDRLRGAREDTQKKAFAEHIRLSKQFGRPLIIHAVKAQPWLESFWTSLPQKFVFHSYSGKAEMLKQVIAHGGYISFSASVLKISSLQNLVNQLPPEKLLLETDGPYQSPVLGEESNPEVILRLSSLLAKCYDMPEKDFTAQVYNNSLEFIKTWKTTSVF